MYTTAKAIINQQLAEIQAGGLHKSEHVITSAQQAHVRVTGGQQVLNMCANNYLGLADDPRIIEAVKQSLDHWGFGCASVRFICGTQ
ncbi:MAG TPA: glycine C-acetyltransferase, partial [Phycisphaerales bacterium]|nr:glycine C-acetyltransferase [Phycisphaerales bacterium]